MDCVIKFEEVKTNDGRAYEACVLYIGKARIILRDYKAIDMIRFVKSIQGD